MNIEYLLSAGRRQKKKSRRSTDTMRKRRAQGQQAAASGAFSWVVFYAFRSLFRRGLDNLSRLPTDRAGKALSRLGFHRLKCVDRRYLFRCRSASFFRRMAAT